MAAPAQAGPARPAAPKAARTAPGRTKATGAEAAAIDQAQKTGEAVVVDALTDEASTTTANPDGTFTRTMSSSPRRVRRAGGWVPIDTTLVKQPDGSYAPKAVSTELTIGGSGGMIASLTDGHNKLGFHWDKELPTPSVVGDTATYANVLPDIDLRVTADASGYSSVFVVKTPEAAANPALQQLDLGLKASNLKLKETSNGGAEASDAVTGEPIFHTDTSLMWDSSTPADAPPAATGLVAKRTRAGPDRVGGHSARIGVAVRNGKQRLNLDQALLKAKTTKYPVYVDPIWSGSPGKSQLNWARISSNGWNIYNSTSKSSTDSARIGYDDWAGGEGERAVTYYQMNTSGIKGAKILGADLYVVEHWAAGCTSTNAVVYASDNPSGWNSSGLNWDKQPKRGDLLSTKGGGRVDCGDKNKERTSPASLDFNVTNQIKIAADKKANSQTFLVQAQNMNDKNAWKQLGFGGGATLSVKYSFPPKLLDGDGHPTVKPSITNVGKLITTTHTPTLSARATNPDLAGGYEKVMVDYHVFNSAGKLVAYGYGPTSGFTQYGMDWTTPSLPDGTYTWQVTAENENKIWMSGWGALHTFTIDTEAPHAPTVSSTQFPPAQVGAAFDSKGLFALGNDRTNNVVGYLFSLDGDLANTVYSSTKGTAWTSSTVLKPGTIYFAKADNATGTGTAVVNGNAGLSFAPGTVGAHTLFAKAVDQAGTTSPQASYVFNAGTSSPTYAYGDKMITGYTATNADGTTTTVPAAVKTSVGGMLRSQTNQAGIYYADGFQAMLSNNSTTATKVASGDSMKLSFGVPSTGAWDLGVNFTIATDYATFTLTLDAGTANAKVLTPQAINAWSPVVLTRYLDFGLLKNPDGSLLVLNQGVHTLTLNTTGKNASSNGFQAGIDVIRLAPTLSCTTTAPAGCLNNVVTSTYTAGTTPKVTGADGDGGGASFEATDLTSMGWTGGRTVTVNGAAIKLPPAFGTGAKDNMLASGQFVIVPASGAVNKGNAVVFVGFATGTAAIKHATGTISYAAGSGCDVASQSYTIDTVRDWGSKDRGALVTFTHRNKSDATQSTAATSLFTFSVPLTCPGATVSTITLPLVTNSVLAGAASLHFLGLGIRPLASGAATAWTSSWSMVNDTGFVQSQPTDTNAATVNASLSSQTLRIPAYLSLGSTGKVRVHLSNITGKVPVTFGAASVAVQDKSKGATAEAAPVPLTFGGAAGVSLPPGTETVSDPVDLSVAAQRTVLVSLKVNGTVNSVSGHLDARTPTYLTASDNADHTGEAAGSAFTPSTLTGVPYLAAIDVSTAADAPTGSVVLYGDQTVNADTATANGRSHLSELLADSLALEDSTDRTVPFGLLNQGSSSWNNRVLLPQVGDQIVANSANGTVDQQILAQPGVHTVLVSAGTTDLLSCTDAADTCAKLVEDKLVALTTQVHQYRTDEGARIEVNVATLPPFNGSHTAAQESARQLVNAYIITAGSPLALQGYADGLVDFASAVSSDGTSTSSTLKAADYAVGNGRNLPNDMYYLDLSRQYITDANTGDQDDSNAPGALPAAVWKFGEGSGSTAADTGNGMGIGSDRTLHPATLHNTTWSAGRTTDTKAVTFNGTTSYADTALSMDTTQSFTVSMWARLTDKSSDHTLFAREAKGAYASFYLKYQASSDSWLAEMPSATSGTPVLYDALSSSTAKLGVWTHLAAVYDADETSLTIYVDGQGESSIDGVAPFVDNTGTTLIGHSDTSTFAGDLADVRVWARMTDQAEIADAAQAEPVGIWRLDEGVGSTAGDSSDHAHDATVSGGSSWIAGHSDWDIGALGFNGTDAAATANSVLYTDQSFSVTAWANPSSTEKTATVVGLDGSRSSSFQLGIDKDCRCWAFSLPDADSDGSTRIIAAASGPASVNTWTHLAGVYDAVSSSATLYVNGEPVTTVAVPAVHFKSSGPLTIGRGRANGSSANWFAGGIDDVRLYQGVETDAAIGEDFQS